MNCRAEVDRSSWLNLTGLLFSAGHVQGNFCPCLLEVAPGSVSPLGEPLSLGHKVSVNHDFTLKKNDQVVFFFFSLRKEDVHS